MLGGRLCAETDSGPSDPASSSDPNSTSRVQQINRSKSSPILTVVGLHPNCTQKKYRSHTLSPQGATEIAVGHFSHRLSKEIKQSKSS
uniref:Uncharacterized protein n=1 Tax=Anguilla anguilla TaxID=7936 RepID=A0A0E9X3G0_ANGAN